MAIGDEKLTIHNTGVSWNVALECVRQVINRGRVSDDNTAYCYHTSFTTSEGEVHVESVRRKKSDTFVVYRLEAMVAKVNKQTS